MEKLPLLRGDIILEDALEDSTIPKRKMISDLTSPAAGTKLNLLFHSTSE